MTLSMRFGLAAALSLLLAIDPAAATGGYSCETRGPKPIRLDLVIGHAVAPVVAQATLTEGATRLSTADGSAGIAILQAWIEDGEVRLDLVDPNHERYEARLRVRDDGKGQARGTLERGGVKHPVRCDGEQ